MKKIVEIQEGEGLEALLGQRVTLLCMNYFYTGVLDGVNDSDVLLSNPSIVYETGAWDTKEWEDAQVLPTPSLYVRTAAIEAYGVLK